VGDFLVNWETLSSPEHGIKDLRKTIRDSEVQLTWFWAKEIDFVYIYKTSSDNVKPISEITEQDLRLYTREEYKANHGYIGRLDAIGRHAYRIFPCQKRDGKLVVFSQENDNNLIYLTGSKAKISFSIIYKNKFLKPKKMVRMSIMTELALDKELLVYVKKTGSPPMSIEDGTVFPFIRDFPPGRTELLEKEIGKDEYIRIFFSEARKSAQIFDLIPE
jgi:hypothetical protein